MPLAEPDTGGGMPVVRGGHRRTGAWRGLRSTGGIRDEGEHEFGKGAGGAEDAVGIADGGSPVALRPATTFRRLRTGDTGEAGGDWHAAIRAEDDFARGG